MRMLRPGEVGAICGVGLAGVAGALWEGAVSAGGVDLLGSELL